jgi:hypothetical protein
VTEPPEARPRRPTTNGGPNLSDYAGRKGALPTWPRVGVVVALFVLIFFVARGCQNNQIKISQDDAVAEAKEQIDFTSTSTQIRLLRQGLDRHPYWVVSLSVPIGDARNPEGFRRLAVVRIDATNGDVASVQEQQPAKPGQGGGGSAAGQGSS